MCWRDSENAIDGELSHSQLYSFSKYPIANSICSISIWGVFQFNHSNALITPIWLALHLLTSPSAVRPTPDDVSIDPIDLLVLPVSFIIGFVVPLAPVMLPFSVISVRMKQTAMGWYQQWPLWISIPHYILAAALRSTSVPSKVTDGKIQLFLYRSVYIFAFAFAVLTHLPVMVLSFTAALWPAFFNHEFVHLLQPKHLIVPANPFSGVKAENLAQGMFWLIQWDYFSGYLAPAVWGFILYRRAGLEQEKRSSWRSCLKRAALYTLLAGPIGVAVGMIWERDEMLFGQSQEIKSEEHPKLADNSK